MRKILLIALGLFIYGLMITEARAQPKVSPVPAQRIYQQITVRFIPLGSSDGSVAASIDKNWCTTRLTEISAVFEPAGLQFVFGSLGRLTKDDQLNLDVPPGDKADGIETARENLAVRFPKELVVFVRVYRGNEAGKKDLYKAFNYSSDMANYVVAEPGSESWTLAHEFGHFFGLFHTFDGDLLDGVIATKPANRLQYLGTVLAQAITSHKVTEEKALDFLDGDRGSVNDTPPDAGPPPFQPNDKAGEESGPGSNGSLTILVVLGGNTTPGPAPRTVKYVLKPDKLNVMSYFTFTDRPHLSPQQALVVHKIVTAGKRKRLIQ